MKVETWKIDRVKPYERNPRINDAAVEAVAASIREFGFRPPIVVDKRGVIIAGHTRWKAAKLLGMTTVPVHVAKDLTPEQVKALRIADNKVGEVAKWDEALLSLELADLFLKDYDLSLTGFESDEWSRLLAPATGGLSDPDEVPEPPAVPRTKPGDLYILGEHRLLCGDSTKAEDVKRAMRGEKASCVFTDPPYGVSIAKKNRLLNSLPNPKGGGNSGKGRNAQDIIDDDMTPDQLEVSLLAAFVNVRLHAMSDDCTLFVCSPQGCGLSMMMMMMMQKAGLKARHILIWVKNQPTFSMGRLDYDYQHEPILLTWLARHKRPMLGEHRTSVWAIDKPRASPDHPTTKPVALYVNAYQNNSEAGDNVFDAYSGSGTAFIAAEQVGRRCFGLEIEPRYCDVIVARWEKFTGQKARLEGAPYDYKRGREDYRLHKKATARKKPKAKPKRAKV